MKQIPLFKLTAIPQDNEAKILPKFKWADDVIGTRHQLGGKPFHTDETDYPLCPDCGKRMSFYGQLDSINDDIIIADCGLIAVYICFDCLEVFAEIISG